MDPAIKKVVAVLAAALIVVIGVICVINFANMDAAVTTENEIRTQENQNIEDNVQADADAELIAQEKPTDEAQAGGTGVTNEAQSDETAQDIVMYEGALAGLSEEEIAKMALAEEESAARTETTGVEDAVD
ncbi:MAG: hypothetical protein ACI4MM_07930 [Candidatus Ventricola sp.]